MGKNFSIYPSAKGLIFRIYNELKLQEKKQTHSKVVKDMNRYFSKADIYEANKHEKMLLVTGHQRDANQNHIEIPSHAS